jgi:hypothetical protein
VADRIGEVLSDAPAAWVLGPEYAANDNWGDLDRSHAGKGPLTRHEIGVEAAKGYFRSKEYEVLEGTNIPVIVPGFATPRIYDFLVRDRRGVLIGIEVKTTLYDLIRLKLSQVEKDVAVVRFRGEVPSLGEPIGAVSYVTYCWDCDGVPDLESIALSAMLRLHGISFTHHRIP